MSWAEVKKINSNINVPLNDMLGSNMKIIENQYEIETPSSYSHDSFTLSADFLKMDKIACNGGNGYQLYVDGEFYYVDKLDTEIKITNQSTFKEHFIPYETLQNSSNLMYRNFNVFRIKDNEYVAVMTQYGYATASSSTYSTLRICTRVIQFTIINGEVEYKIIDETLDEYSSLKCYIGNEINVAYLCGRYMECMTIKIDTSNGTDTQSNTVKHYLIDIDTYQLLKSDEVINAKRETAYDACRPIYMDGEYICISDSIHKPTSYNLYIYNNWVWDENYNDRTYNIRMPYRYNFKYIDNELYFVDVDEIMRPKISEKLTAAETKAPVEKYKMYLMKINATYDEENFKVTGEITNKKYIGEGNFIISTNRNYSTLAYNEYTGLYYFVYETDFMYFTKNNEIICTLPCGDYDVETMDQVLATTSYARCVVPRFEYCFYTIKDVFSDNPIMDKTIINIGDSRVNLSIAWLTSDYRIYVETSLYIISIRDVSYTLAFDGSTFAKMNRDSSFAYKYKIDDIKKIVKLQLKLFCRKGSGIYTDGTKAYVEDMDGVEISDTKVTTTKDKILDIYLQRDEPYTIVI